MKNFHLILEEINELRAAHAVEHNRSAAYKINAVILLGKGWTPKEMREALLLDEETLRSYVKKYQTGGILLLRHTNYLGKQANFDDEQLRKFHNALDEKI